jgi:hypothetical protein
MVEGETNKKGGFQYLIELLFFICIPDAFFWAGSNYRPGLQGFIVPNEYGRQVYPFDIYGSDSRLQHQPFIATH